MEPQTEASARSTASEGSGWDEGHPPPISSDVAPEGPDAQAPSVEQQPPAGLTPAEYASLRRLISSQHTYTVGAGQCSSLLSQRTSAPADLVWSYVRRFDRPQVYKHFIRSCVLKAAESEAGNGSAPGSSEPVLRVGCLRELRVISGLPASTSTDRLDVLDDDNRVTGYTIVGGEHRLRNYRSTTTVSEVGGSTVVLESYVVDIPEGNTQEDTRLFADTVVRLNLQKLAHIAEAAAAAAAAVGVGSSNNHLQR